MRIDIVIDNANSAHTTMPSGMRAAFVVDRIDHTVPDASRFVPPADYTAVDSIMDFLRPQLPTPAPVPSPN
jgi:hypothetical protein